MITAKIVKYYNDYNQTAFNKTFQASIFRRYKSGYYRKIQTVYAR